MKRQLLTTFFALLLLIGYTDKQVLAEKDSPEIYSEYGIVIDAYNGNVLFEKNIDEQSYPASITKVLTAILLEDHMEDGEIITASKEATMQTPSNSIFLLQEGEKITKEQALNLLMMISSNDVAHAVGEHISGDIESFSELMNEKAEALGAKNSDFRNASGLPNEFHKTTVYDMALITKEVLKYPNIIKAMQLDEFILETDRREVPITKTHKILEENEFAIGGKTGYTGDAKNTLVEIMKKDGATIIAVTMKAPGGSKAYEDMNTLSEFAFKQIKTVQAFQKDDLVYRLENGNEIINLYAKSDVTISTNNRTSIENRIRLLDQDKFKANETIGYLEIINNGEVEAKFPLYSKFDVRIISEKPLTKVEELAISVKENKNIPTILSVVFGIPLSVLCILLLITTLLRKRKLDNF